MYEEVKFGDIEYTKFPPLNGLGVYIETSLPKLTREGLYRLISSWERDEFMNHIGDDADEIFKREESTGDRHWYEMVYKPGSWAAVLVRQR